MAQQWGIEAYVHDGTAEEDLPVSREALPCDVAVIRELLARCPVVLSLPDQEDAGMLPYHLDADSPLHELPDVTLFQASPSHIRSYEVAAPWLPTRWQDERGMVYRGLSIKGPNMAQPAVVPHNTDPDGFMLWGLQDSRCVGRALRASRVLRERGISTEYPIGLAEFSGLVIPTTGSRFEPPIILKPEDYKEVLIDVYLMDVPEAQRTAEMMDQLDEAVTDPALLVTLRATDSPYRLHDLRYKGPLAAVYDIVNTELLRPGDQPFSADDPEDLRRYVHSYWVPAAARNLALMHVDLCHRYLHGGNYTALLGGIVDLDSVRGPGLGLGDEPVTAANLAEDLLYTFDALVTLRLPYLGSRREETGIFREFIARYAQQREELASYASQQKDGPIATTYLIAAVAALARQKLTSAKRQRDAIANEMLAYIVMDGEGLAAIPQDAVTVCHEFAVDLAGDEDAQDLLAGLVARSIDHYAYIATGYVAEAVAQAKKAGHHFDITKAFANLENLQEMAVAILFEDISSWFDEKLEHRLITDGSALVPEFAVLSGSDKHRPLWRKVLYDNGHAYNQHISDWCMAMLYRFRDELSAKTGLPVPDQLLGDTVGKSTVLVDLAPGRYSWITEAVPYGHISARLVDEPDVTVVAMPDDDRWTVSLSTEGPGIAVAEIISDAQNHSVDFEDGTNGPVWQAEFIGSPQYVLVVLERPDGSHHFRLHMRDAAGTINGTLPLF